MNTAVHHKETETEKKCRPPAGRTAFVVRWHFHRELVVSRRILAAKGAFKRHSVSLV